jgi:hypothetical protein
MGPGSADEHERDRRGPLGRFRGYNATNELKDGPSTVKGKEEPPRRGES